MSASRWYNSGQAVFIPQCFDFMNRAGHGGLAFRNPREFTSIINAKWEAIDINFPAIEKLTFGIRRVCNFC